MDYGLSLTLRSSRTAAWASAPVATDAIKIGITASGNNAED
jgi:hypothetical protein